MRITLAAILPLAVLACPALATAQAPGAAPAHRVTAVRAPGPIDIDGRLDEAAWRRAGVAGDFVQSAPTPGAPATLRTEARVLFDDESVYIGMRMYDVAPDSVVGRLARRDEDVFSDWAMVYIDSRDDRRTAFAFALNAAGLQRDELIFDDDRRDPDWDAVWDGATRADRDGWTAEFRVPYSQLRFSGADRIDGEDGAPVIAGDGAADAARARSDDGAASPAMTWGVNFGRRIARRDETAYWTPIPRDEGVFVSRFGRLGGLRGIDPPRGVEVSPYTVARLTRAPGDPDDPFHEETAPSGAAGGDVRVGLGSGLTLNATFNPDFGQVEADPSVINLTAFETRFDEKRPFFLEGSELFRIDGLEAFYSRRIGRSPQGGPPGDALYSDVPEAAAILGATKLSGKTDGGWSIGVLDAVTAAERASYLGADGVRGTAEVEPAANYAVARVARDLRGGGTTVGGLVTATHRRLGDDSPDLLRSAAYVGGLDARHRFADGRYEASAAVVGSHVRGSAEAIAGTQLAPGRYFQRPDADHLDYDPSRTTLSGAWARAAVGRIAGGNWRWRVDGLYTGPGFELNDLGFLRTTDRMSQRTQLRYVDFDAGHGLRQWSAGVAQFAEWTTGRERIDLNATLQASAVLESGWGTSVWTMRHEGGIDPDALRGGPALLVPGRYMGGGMIHSDRRRSINGNAGFYWEVEDGTAGTVVRLNGGLTVRPTPRMDLSLSPHVSRVTSDWQYVTRRTVDGAPHYVLGRLRQRTASLAARLNYTVSPTLSIQAYAQPFIGAGEYERLQTVRDPLADGFADRFHVYGPDEVSVETADDTGARVFHVRPGGGDADAFSLSRDFNIRQLRSNLVARWEYRPGSTLFLVWTQDRAGRSADGSFRLGPDLRELADAPARNVFLIKVSYWLGL